MDSNNKTEASHADTTCWTPVTAEMCSKNSVYRDCEEIICYECLKIQLSVHHAYIHTWILWACVPLRVCASLCKTKCILIAVFWWTNIYYMDSTCSVYVCATIVKHIQCKQMVMINRDIGLYYQFQLQRENCLKKIIITCPEVWFYCFPFLLLAIIRMAKGKQHIDYLTRMFTKAKLGSLKMKRTQGGGEWRSSFYL